MCIYKNKHFILGLINWKIKSLEVSNTLTWILKIKASHAEIKKSLSLDFPTFFYLWDIKFWEFRTEETCFLSPDYKLNKTASGYLWLNSPAYALLSVTTGKLVSYDRIPLLMQKEYANLVRPVVAVVHTLFTCEYLYSNYHLLHTLSILNVSLLP